MSKKVISLALVVVMLFSMASVASAALGSGKKMGFTVTADKTTVEAGETVEIIVSVEVPADDTVWGGGVIPLAYDKDVISEACVSGGSQLFGSAAYGVCLTFPAEGFGTTVDTANTCIDPVDFSSVTLRTEDEGKNWNAITAPAITNNGTNYTFTANTVEEIFRYTFTVADDAAAGEKIYVGIPAGAFDGDPPIGMMYSEAYGMEYWVDYDGEVYDFTDATVELTVASAAEPTVTHVKTMGQMKDWKDTTATTYNAGLVGKISNIGELTFDESGECNEIKTITVTINEAVSNAYQVYKQADGSYWFRAVVYNASMTNDTVFDFTYTVTLADGSELTGSGSSDFATIYNTAKANYDAANA